MPGSGLILGIETSCDETAAAVVERGARTLSSVVASQITTHARYGGVVPELASREHLRAIVPVVRAALAEARVTLADLDAIAVTSGPGLAGALLVGITYAKALAFANNLPLIAVNHLEGHIHAVLLQERESAQAESNSISQAMADAAQNADHAQNMGAPGPSRLGTWDSAHTNPESALALVVSGGHTHLFLAQPANGSWSYTLIGRTVDDAAGEAFDKVAKLLGLGYPGGPWIDALAPYGNPHAVPFAFAQFKPKAHLAGKAPPRTKAAKDRAHRAPRPALSLLIFGNQDRRAALRRAPRPARRIKSSRQPRAGQLRPPQTREEALALCPQPTLDLIASFQHAVVGDLMKKTFAAAESLGAKRILVTGGVAANHELRARFTAEAEQRGLRIAFPTLALSTDNAAMIAAAAWPRLLARDFAPPELTADPSLALS
jgi:N6-L-threonylcarbamoyladenine synthase